jgi:hypothetical protein
MELIEHLDHSVVLTLTNEIDRVCVPGAVVVLTTPQKQGSALSSPYHVQEFSAPALAALAKRFLADVRVYGYLSRAANRTYVATPKPLRLGWKLLGMARIFNPHARKTQTPTDDLEGLAVVGVTR